MKFFEKIYDFIIDYEDILKLVLFLLIVLIFMCIIIGYFDNQLTIKKNIIINTKDYVIYDNCKILDNKFYCWNDFE